MKHIYKLIEVASDKSNCCIARQGGKMMAPKQLENGDLATYYTLLVVKFEEKENGELIAEGVVAARDDSFKDLKGMIKLTNYFIKDYIKAEGKIGEVTVSGKKIIRKL